MSEFAIFIQILKHLNASRFFVICVGEFDVLSGINLLREGLDLPEVSLVAILDADKEGFLKFGAALIQTIGRRARNCEWESDPLCRQNYRLDEAGS